MRIATLGSTGVYMTKHATERARQRGVTVGKIAACILWLGTEKLEELAGNDIIVHSEEAGISIVATVERKRVKIITVVAKAHTFVTDVDKVRITIA